MRIKKLPAKQIFYEILRLWRQAKKRMIPKKEKENDTLTRTDERLSLELGLMNVTCFSKHSCRFKSKAIMLGLRGWDWLSFTN